MDTRRRLVFAGLVVLICAAVGLPAAHAEVSAEVDAFGDYIRTVILSNGSVKNPRIWSLNRERWQYSPLNPGGDDNGDLFPVIGEDALHFNHPWIVWSRFDGEGYSLAWSRWTGVWEPIRWLGSGSPALGDDLDPALTLDATGRPFAVWWRNEQGIGRVYLSLFLDTRWMEPLPVSDAGVDSRYPALTLQGDLIVVRYETAEGESQRVLGLATPDSINDDINPFESFTPPEPMGVPVGDNSSPFATRARPTQ